MKNYEDYEEIKKITFKTIIEHPSFFHLTEYKKKIFRTLHIKKSQNLYQKIKKIREKYPNNNFYNDLEQYLKLSLLISKMK